MLPLKSITSRRPVVKRPRTLASRTIPMVLFAGALAGGVMLAAAGLSANDWPEWRGPARDGQSTEKGLPEKWSPAGEGLAWKVPIGSRSGPIVVGDRLYMFTHAGSHYALEAPDTQERLICLDVNSGKLIWEHKINMFHSDVPAHRVAWASPAADPATGNVYAHGDQGILMALSPEGKLLWERSLNEEFGAITTHGGRTTSPIVEGDLVIVNVLNAGWGTFARTGNRYFAFDKKTGESVWVSSPQARHYDTNYSTPVAATVDGTRMILVGGTDGAMHAIKAWTGEPVWKFEMSKRAINTSAVMNGDDAIVTHSEENYDTNEMGLLAAIDAKLTGEIKKENLRWGVHGFQGGFGSPVIDKEAGRIYMVDNGAVLAGFDLKDGRKLWDKNLGTLQKGSPVFADGKLYVGTENGKFYILRPKADGVDILDEDVLGTGGAEEPIVASPAIANGRIYVASMGNLYAIGPKTVKAAPRAKPAPAAAAAAKGAGPATLVQVRPFDKVIKPNEKVKFDVRLYDAKGNAVAPQAATFTLEGLKGTVAADGTFTPDAAAGQQAGTIKATVGTLSGVSRVRVMPPLPFAANFDDITGEAPPPAWIRATGVFKVADLDGSRVLQRLEDNTPGRRARLFLGTVDMHDYTVEADVRVTERRRQQGDAGLIAQRYQVILFGNSQKMELHPWQANPAVTVSAPFQWKADTWYRVKMRVENLKDGTTRVQGKAWPRDEAEPEKWNVEKVDKLGHRHGAPGLYADSQFGAYYDNVKVTSNAAAASGSSAANR
jgi:outer membrane protein assembly factor BamB